MLTQTFVFSQAGLALLAQSFDQARMVTVVVNSLADEQVVQRVAQALRGNDVYAEQLRNFAESYEKEQRTFGINFNPIAGQVLVCNFGLGFAKPEPVKVRPVLVVSPKARRWTGLSLVIPISSKAPDPVEPYHLKLPAGLIPNEKYAEAWLKGDLVTAVAHRRLDRLKIGRRDYVTPQATPEFLQEARRCILHVAGMHSLTIHW